jgi:hypothetical protein
MPRLRADLHHEHGGRLLTAGGPSEESGPESNVAKASCSYSMAPFDRDFPTKVVFERR